ncbi:transporter substrate-binding domain-containing protein [Halomonas sp. HG01]|uniref:transporter substrate-binding domain-containing protein n=1 Tax=Halomonas sp. HG01 TaxID=1609967 RepID=UPI00191CD6F5|nr:transporter substrate-binding domain-containing protein [Halomonas sp. HG01]
MQPKNKPFIGRLAAAAGMATLAAAIGLVPLDNARAAGEDGTFVFAMDGQYPPFNTRQGQRVYGFDVDIGTAIARQIGMQPEPTVNPWQTLIAALKSDRFDAIIGSMAITEERQKEVAFSDPYYTSGAQVFVGEDSDIDSLDELEGKRIGVLVSSTFQEVAREITDDIQTYPSDVTALNDLTIRGRLDAVITDQLVGEYAINENDLPIQKLGEPLYVDRMGIAVNKEDSELLGKINEALEAIMNDGTYAAISHEYFGRDIMND